MAKTISKKKVEELKKSNFVISVLLRGCPHEKSGIGIDTVVSDYIWSTGSIKSSQ